MLVKCNQSEEKCYPGCNHRKPHQHNRWCENSECFMGDNKKKTGVKCVDVQMFPKGLFTFDDK